MSATNVAQPWGLNVAQPWGPGDSTPKKPQRGGPSLRAALLGLSWLQNQFLAAQPFDLFDRFDSFTGLVVSAEQHFEPVWREAAAD